MRWPKTFKREKRQLALTADHGQSKPILALKQSTNPTNNIVEVNSISGVNGDLLSFDNTGVLLVGNSLSAATPLQVRGNVLFGLTVSSSVASPICLDMGGTYGNNTPGTTGNLKWKMYDDGSGTQIYGIGMSAGRMEYQVPSGAVHTMYVAGTSIVNVANTGTTLAGVTNVSQVDFGSSVGAKISLYGGIAAAARYGIEIQGSEFREYVDNTSAIFTWGTYSSSTWTERARLTVGASAPTISLGTTTANSAINIYAATTTAAAVTWGGDSPSVNLYRSTTSTLKTDANFVVAGTLNSGGITATSITDNISTQKVIISKAGTTVGTRKQINFIEGTNVTLTVADNSGSDRVDVTVTSSGGGGGTPGGSTTQLQYNNAGAFGGTAGLTWNNSTNALTIADASNIILGTTTGTQFGTGTTQKIAFLGSTPIAQQANSVSLETVLSNFGFRASGASAPLSIGTLTIADASNVVLGSTTGTKIGTATTQKVGFLNATPVAQQANSVSLETVLSNFGFRASGTSAPLSIGTLTIADGSNVVLGTTTGTKIGTSTSQKLGFFNATPVVQAANTTSLEQVLSDIGIRASGTSAPISVGAITATSITDNISTQKVIVSYDKTPTGTEVTSGSSSTPYKEINFVPGPNITIIVDDDSTNNRVDITISATTGSGSAGSGVGELPPMASQPIAYSIVSAEVISADQGFIAKNGNHFCLQLMDDTETYTLGDPGAGHNGQIITIEVVQNSNGNGALILDPSYYAFGSTIPSIALTATPNKRDIIELMYSTSMGKWLVINFAKGF